MAFNLRGGSVNIPDGSITESKLATNSVSASKIQTDAVIESKIAASAVSETKIATDAVSTAKIQDNAVVTAKASREIVTEQFLGSEAEFTYMSDTPFEISEFNFIKNSTDEANWKSLSWQVRLLASAGNTAQLNLKIDGTQFSTLGTTSTTYVTLEATNVNISSLAAGKHTVTIEAENTGPTDSLTTNLLEVFLSKK